MSKWDWDGNPALVAFGLVLIGVAAWMSWGLSADQTEIRMRGEQSAQQYIEYAEERIERTCLDREGAALMECIHEEIKSAQDHSRAERDLDAQQAMALWTKLMVLVSVSATILTMFGLYFVWRTLKASESATEAALTAVEVTRETGFNETRPWLLIEADVQGPLEIKDSGIRFSVDYTITNFGSTPAINILFNTLGTIDIEEQNAFFKSGADFAMKGTIGSPYTVYPGKDWKFRQRYLISSDTIARHLDKNSHLKLREIVPSANITVIYCSPFGANNMTTSNNCTIFRRVEGQPSGARFELATATYERRELWQSNLGNTPPPS